MFISEYSLCNYADDSTLFSTGNNLKPKETLKWILRFYVNGFMRIKQHQIQESAIIWELVVKCDT